MLYTKKAKGSVVDVCRKVEEAAKANKFGVIATIDLKAKMAEKGVEFGPECRIIEVCNPVQAKKVLETDMSVSTALPCRICVYEEGGAVVVSALKPTILLELFNDPELAPVARDVENVITRIIDAACC